MSDLTVEMQVRIAALHAAVTLCSSESDANVLWVAGNFEDYIWSGRGKR
jgi:hypothetical protein